MAIGLGRGGGVVAVAGLGHALMMSGRGGGARFAHRHRERRKGQRQCNHQGEEKAYAHARSYGRKAIYWQRHGTFVAPGLALSGEYVYNVRDAAASVISGRLRRVDGAAFGRRRGPKWRSVEYGEKYWYGRPCREAVLCCIAGISGGDDLVEGWGEIVAYVVAVYLVLTAIVGRCLIYRALDVNTCDHGGTYHSGEDPYDGRAGN